jgi:cytochrome c biogenesis protein CcdA/thiol-disulfide isomerase/thioredoxin
MIVLIGIVSGIITGLSPCVLPVLPVVLTSSAGADGKRAKWRPYVVISGLVVSFAVFTLIGGALISALGLPDDFLRIVGLVLLAAIGVGMLVPAIGHALERPFARVPMVRLNRDGNGLVLGMGLGLVFVPCAGPVLAAITVLAATGRVDGRLVLLTVSFAIGVAIPLLFFALAGRTMTQRLKANRERSMLLRKVLGGVLVATALVLALGVAAPLQRATPEFLADLQSRIENSDTAKDQLGGLSGSAAATAPDAARRASGALGMPISFDDCAGDPGRLHNCGPARDFVGISDWLNTSGGKPLSIANLRGKVVLVDFWTYSCINCQRTIPHLAELDQDYRDKGLVIVGVHTPEFPFEKVIGNITDNARKLGVQYPVAVDNAYQTWTNYDQRYWPAHYLIDRQGVVRQVHYGEGAYAETEQLVRQLLAADARVTLPPMSAERDDVLAVDRSPETYLGSNRMQYAVGDRIREGSSATYTVAPGVPRDHFSFGGEWDVEPQFAAAGAGARLRLRYRAQQVHLVLGGRGTVTGTADGRAISPVRVSGSPTLYTLVDGPDREAELDLHFTPGLQAYAFTFG